MRYGQLVAGVAGSPDLPLKQDFILTGTIEV